MPSVLAIFAPGTVDRSQKKIQHFPRFFLPTPPPSGSSLHFSHDFSPFFPPPTNIFHIFVFFFCFFFKKKFGCGVGGMWVAWCLEMSSKNRKAHEGPPSPPTLFVAVLQHLTSGCHPLSFHFRNNVGLPAPLPLHKHPIEGGKAR